MENWLTKRDGLKSKWHQIYPYLDERSRRIWAGVEARQMGRGGKALVRAVTGLDWKRIAKGMEEATARAPVEPRLRSTGGGRKSVQENQSGL